MNEVFQKNLFFLQKFHPHLAELASFTTLSSDFEYIGYPYPNVIYKKRAFHSRKNPFTEADNLVGGLKVKKGQMYIFFGIGMGYHIQSFMNLYQNMLNQITVIAVEASPDSFTLLVQNRDISFLRGIKLFVGTSAQNFETFLKSIDPTLFRGYRIIKLRGAVSAFGNYYQKIEECFRTFMSTKLSDILTRLNFESLWIKNIIQNISYLERSSSVDCLKNSLRGNPALVICAGPSLKEQLGDIAEVSSRIYIIAVDTVVEPLIRAGVIPDFVVTLDAQYYNFHDFRYLFTLPQLTERIILVSDITVYPGIPRRWQGRVYFSATPLIMDKEGKIFSGYHPLLESLKGYIEPPGLLECGGSVSTTAMEFALYAGAHPVMVTGLDLSYTGFLTHVCSSPQYNMLYLSSSRLRPIQGCFLNAIIKRKLRWLKGMDNEKVLSDFILEKYLRWIESRKNYTGKVFNLTSKGAKIASLPHLDIKEVKRYPVLSEKKHFAMVNNEKIIKKNSAELLTFLENQIVSAQKNPALSLATDESLYKLAKNYPFMENIIRGALSLYHDPDKAAGYIYHFLGMCKKQVDRMISRYS